MAKRRCFSVKKCQSAQFLDMSAGAQALYLAILGICDDDGIFQLDFAKRIAGRRRQDADALISNGYISIIDDALNIGYVIDWQAFNTLDPRYSTPSDYRQTLIDTIPNIENALFTPKKDIITTGNTRVNKTKNKQNKTKKNQYDDDFEAAWKEYPRQEGKQTGLKYYSKSRRGGATAQEILDGVKRYSVLVKHEKRDRQYIKAGGNFFKEELWKEPHTIRHNPAIADDSDMLGGLL